LDDATAPALILNQRREILVANAALGRWLGIEPRQLVGRRCDYHAAADDALAAVCAALCPPPEAFAGQVEDGFISRLASGERPFERRPARFVRVPGGTDEQMWLLVLLRSADDAAREESDNPLRPDRLHGLLLKQRGDLARLRQAATIIGQSPALARVREQVRLARQTAVRVVIVGQAGTGREHVARAIHYGQPGESVGALAPIACPLVDAEQMQASLAAILRRQHQTPTDRPPAALLLDVDRLGEGAQQELAGFLALPGIELHTLATARRSLVRLAARGRFRTDLAHALGTLVMALPPLAERREDIPLLAQHFLEEANAAGGPQKSGFHPAAMELLVALPWRGNVDELARAVREAAGRSKLPQVTLADLPDWIHLAKSAADRPSRNEPPIELDIFMAEVEKELLSRALRRARGNKSKAAQLLGLSRARLLRRLAQHGLIAPAEAEEPVIFEPLPEES
jgi:hypothetical protein